MSCFVQHFPGGKLSDFRKSLAVTLFLVSGWPVNPIPSSLHVYTHTEGIVYEGGVCLHTHFSTELSIQRVK